MLERVYCWIVAPATILLVVLIGPLEGSDEHTHLFRIDAISNGSVIPAISRMPSGEPAAGGQVDVRLRDWATQMTPSYGDTVERRSATAVLATFNRRADGETTFTPHSNTAIYPPLLYLQSTAALAIARALDVPVAVWLYVARLSNAVAAVFIIALAMRRMPSFRPMLLTVAALPIVMYLSATASADAVLMPVTVVFTALVARLSVGELSGRGGLLALACATFFLCVGKVAYLPLSLLPPLAARAADRRWSRRAIGMAVASATAIAAWAAWAWIVHDKIFTIRPDHPIDPAGQLRWILANPGQTALVFLRTLATNARFLASTAMGSHLGNLNLRLFHPLIYLALLTFAFTAVVNVVPTAARPRWMTAFVFSLLAAISVVIVLLLYLQFNVVGHREVEGLQGRYFLPLLVVGAVFWPFKTGPRAQALIERLASCFAIASVLTTLWTVARAYWTI